MGKTPEERKNCYNCSCFYLNWDEKIKTDSDCSQERVEVYNNGKNCRFFIDYQQETCIYSNQSWHKEALLRNDCMGCGKQDE